MLDQSYRVIRRIRSANGFRPDLHEFVSRPRHGAVHHLPDRARGPEVGGAPKRGRLVDSVIQEVDIATGLVAFEWHSSARSRSRDTFSKPVRARARRSTTRTPTRSTSTPTATCCCPPATRGRSTRSTARPARSTGAWAASAAPSSSAPARTSPGSTTLRRAADGALTLFDNSAFPPVRKHSRALALRLDETAQTATLLSARPHPREAAAATQGNIAGAARAATPGRLGLAAATSPSSRRAAACCSTRGCRVGYETYRAYRLPWVGQPPTRPRSPRPTSRRRASTSTRAGTARPRWPPGRCWPARRRPR